MKKVLLSLTVVSSLLFAACSEGEDSGEEGTEENAPAENKDGEEAKKDGEEEKTESATYVVNAEESYVKWNSFMKNNPDHGHTGTVAVSEGKIMVEGEKVKGGNFTFDISSLKEPGAEEEKVKDLTGHLKGEDFFAVESNGQPTFELTGIEGSTVKGKLTANGVTQNVAFDAEIKMEGDKMMAKAKDFEVNFVDFKMPWFAQDKEEEKKILNPSVKFKELKLVASKQ